MSIETEVCQIVIKKASGYNLISRDEFISFSLLERTRLILEGKVQFLNHQGKVIPLAEGVRSLHATEPA